MLLYNYVICGWSVHGVNHGAGAYQRVARISTRENRVKKEFKVLVGIYSMVHLFFSGIGYVLVDLYVNMI